MQTAREREEELLLSLATELNPEDMPSDTLQWAAKAIGVAPCLRLILELSGITFYIPKSAKTMLKKMYVIKKFDGSNLRSLAHQLGLAERTIRDWTKVPGENNQQLSLPFEAAKKPL